MNGPQEAEEGCHSRRDTTPHQEASSRANAKNLQTFEAAISKTVPVTLDRTNIFNTWMQDEGKQAKQDLWMPLQCEETCNQWWVCPNLICSKKGAQQGSCYTGKSSRLAQNLVQPATATLVPDPVPGSGAVRLPPTNPPLPMPPFTNTCLRMFYSPPWVTRCFFASSSCILHSHLKTNFDAS